MWLMERVTKEARDVCTTPLRQQPARAVCTFEKARDSVARQSSDGGPDRRRRLDRAGVANGEGPQKEAQERGGPAAALARHARGADLDGDSETPLPRGGGANSVLRASAIPVRPDRDRLDAGLHDNPGL